MANAETGKNITLFDGPAQGGAAVTPDNTTDMVRPARRLYIGGAGSGGLVVKMKDGSIVTFAGVTAGILDISVWRVNSTGTNVTGIVALY
jgi:hypothetical protein